MTAITSYQPVRRACSRFVTVRGLRHHVMTWGDPATVAPGRPPLVLVHGWMDLAASFQFMVDALPSDRHVIAFDWRGFGQTDKPAADTYWMPDYLADLDAMLDALVPGTAVDLLGHSMGGNLVMLYAGVRPARIRRLINLEGFGMPQTRPEEAPPRLTQWLDDLKITHRLRAYADRDSVAARLRKTNPLLRPDRAQWLAGEWAHPQTLADGSVGPWELLADPAHKRAGPLLYHVEDVLACWKLITAPLLWVEGDQSDLSGWWGERYNKAQFHERLAVVPQTQKHLLAPAGHMLHHDQPEALAARLEDFLRAA